MRPEPVLTDRSREEAEFVRARLGGYLARVKMYRTTYGAWIKDGSPCPILEPVVDSLLDRLRGRRISRKRARIPKSGAKIPVDEIRRALGRSGIPWRWATAFVAEYDAAIGYNQPRDQALKLALDAAARIEGRRRRYAHHVPEAEPCGACGLVVEIDRDGLMRVHAAILEDGRECLGVRRSGTVEVMCEEAFDEEATDD